MSNLYDNRSKKAEHGGLFVVPAVSAGQEIEIEKTVNAPYEALKVFGKSEQKAQWNQAEGVTSQVVTTDGQGKNKFDKSKYLKLSDYTLPEGATYTYAEIPLEPNKTYTVSVVRKDGFDGTGYGYLLMSDTSGINNNFTAIAHQTDASANNSPYTVDSSGKLYIGYHPTYPSAMTQEKLDYIWEHTDVQIEEGTTATTYEDYVYDRPSPSHPSDLTSNIPAGSYQIPTENGIYEVTLTEDLRGLDDTYRDKICFDSVSGKGYLEQNTQADHIKNYTLLNLNLLTHETLHFVYNAANIDKSKLTYSDVGKIKCTHFQYVSGSYHPTSNNIHLYLSPDTNNNIFFDIRKENLDITDFSDRTANIESCKRWLNENDPIVISPRTTPFKTALTFTKVTSSTLPVLPWTAYGDNLINYLPLQNWKCYGTSGGTDLQQQGDKLVYDSSDWANRYALLEIYPIYLKSFYISQATKTRGIMLRGYKNGIPVTTSLNGDVYNTYYKCTIVGQQNSNQSNEPQLKYHITITADVDYVILGLFSDGGGAQAPTVREWSQLSVSADDVAYGPFNPTPPKALIPAPDYPYQFYGLENVTVTSRGKTPEEMGTPYDEYRCTSATVPIALKSCGEDADYLLSDGQTVKRYQYIQDIVIDGTLNNFVCNVVGSTSDPRCQFYVKNNTVSYDRLKQGSTVQNSHGFATQAKSDSGNYLPYIIIPWSVLGLTSAPTTAEANEAAKNYCAAQNALGTPLIIRYVLYTPVITDCTDTWAQDLIDLKTAPYWTKIYTDKETGGLEATYKHF